MTAYPCTSPPFSRPVGGLVAQPAPWPTYSIPCSHLLDAPYADVSMARTPWPYESETRAAGTGLISAGQASSGGGGGGGGGGGSTCPPIVYPPCSSSPWCGIWQPWNPF